MKIKRNTKHKCRSVWCMLLAFAMLFSLSNGSLANAQAVEKEAKIPKEYTSTNTKVNLSNTNIPANDTYLHLTEVPEGYIGIYTKEDLGKINDNMAGNYILMNDIEIPGGGVDQNSSNAIISNFDTIDGNFTSTAFSGILDGNGYMVSNLFLNSNGGLFYNVTGTIRNLDVHAVVSSGNQGNYGSIGGIANLVNGGLIENCRFDGQVILQKIYEGSEPDRYAVGGIAGRVQSGKIKNCANYGDVAISYNEWSDGFTMPVYAGGIAGEDNGWLNAFENSANYGNIILTDDCSAVVGGILGRSGGADINACFNAGSLYVKQTEEVTEKSVTIGGVIGEITDDAFGNATTVANIYNTGYWDIDSPADLCMGGVIGSMTKSTLSGAYNTGTIFHDSGSIIGGIAGRLDDQSTIESVYYPDLYTSARADIELTDGQYTWEDLQWNIQNLANEQQYDDSKGWWYPWSFSEDSSYPYPQLSENPYRAFRFGSGTEEDPYQVRNMQELNAVRYQPSACFQMTQDITCTTDSSGTGSNSTHPVCITGYKPKWYPIGSYTQQGFEGTFDGDGHTITGIYTDWTAEDYTHDLFYLSFQSNGCYMGLFGCNRGIIQNLTVANPMGAEGIFDDSNAARPHFDTVPIVGSIAGYNDGTIRHCVNQASVISSIEAGGIAGNNYGIIEQCVNEGFVRGDVSAGGITVRNGDIIRECANIGDGVSKLGPLAYDGVSYEIQTAGGIAVINDSNGSITNSYNTAQVLCIPVNIAAYPNVYGIAGGGTIENCYNIGQVNLPKSGTFGTGSPIGGDNVSNVYAWNMDNKGSESCFRTLEEMKQQQTYAGFDFEMIWAMPTDGDYPFPVLRNVNAAFTKYPIGMVMTKRPSRHVFLIDEELKTAITDGEFIIYYNDGSFTTDTTKYARTYQYNYKRKMFEWFDILETVGSHSLVVFPHELWNFCYYDTFEGVSEKLPTDMKITNIPVNTVYYEGDELDLNGLEVTVFYNTEQQEIIEDYIVTGYDNTKVGKQIVTVSYGGFSQTFEVTVNHDWETEFTIDKKPACTEPGSKSRHCARCDGKTDVTEIPATGHSFVWVVDTPATEDAPGVQHEECSICGYKQNENTEIPQLPHVHTGITHHEAVTATCHQPGTIEYWTCSSDKCAGKYYSDANCTAQITTITTAIDPNNHDGGTEMKNAVKATCNTDGYTGDTYCLGCGALLSKGTVIVATGHTGVVTKEAKAPTCTEAGWTEEIRCSICDAILQPSEPIAALGHSFTNYIPDNNATCTTDGTKTATCDRCHVTDTRNDVGSALGHNFKDYIADGNATCVQDGTATTTCDRCGATETYVIVGSALGHDMEERRTEPGFTFAGAVDTVCRHCGALQSHLILPQKKIETALTDVTSEQWFAYAIGYSLDYKLMQGTSYAADGRQIFLPDTPMTRAELVTVLYNMEGQPSVPFEALFDDVSSDQWFAAQVTWASQNELVFGTGNRKFEPDTPISRQDLATILYRYAVDYKGIKMNVENVDALLGAFSDADRVGSYAKVAMAAMNQAVVITGDGDRLKPQENATRAEVASMLSRYLPNVLQADQTNG